MRRAQDRALSARSKKNGARSATIKSRASGVLKFASDENVPARRADFLFMYCCSVKENTKSQSKIRLRI